MANAGKDTNGKDTNGKDTNGSQVSACCPASVPHLGPVSLAYSPYPTCTVEQARTGNLLWSGTAWTGACNRQVSSGMSTTRGYAHHL